GDESDDSDGDGSGDDGSGSGSDSSGSSGSGSGSDKSTAIVPVDWSPTGYTALFALEAPEVRFDDVVIAREITARETRVPIDPRFVSVCAAGTIEVCGAQPDQPVAVGARVEGSEVVVTLPRARKRPLRVVVRLTGIRRGHDHKRFPPRS